MGENSKIEWTHHTFNPWIGCQKVSAGCDHCYAESLSKRYGWTEWGQRKTDATAPSVGSRKRTSAATWRKPLQWAKTARGASERPRVFCASLADVFDNQVPSEWRKDLFHLIWNTPELDWLLLTKRPENIEKMLPAAIGETELWPWPNVWLGTTCEDQDAFDRRWAVLSEIPAAVRFISYEPAIGHLWLPAAWMATNKPDWIICGGESGHGARYMEPDWAKSLQMQCREYGIKFFMKQMTGKAPIPADLLLREFPRAA